MSTPEALQYFGGDELPASVFIDKYALRDPSGALLEVSPEQKHRRLARELARVERGKFRAPFSEEEIYSWLAGYGEIIPQGSPMYGIGNPSFVSVSNCFVLDSPLDSYGGIHWTDEQITQISKRRGGVGLDVSNLRPAGTPTTNSARSSSGLRVFCERFSNSIREVGQNGRRGALMLTVSVHHPDVLDFARMKLDRVSVTGANISVRLTNEFMAAVEKDEAYEQRWPVEGEPRFRRQVSAREVWREIIRCAWTRAEPGLLFWDNILRESPADCYAADGFATVSTNPCSELPLCPLDSCRLLVLNLFAFVRDPFTPHAAFDWDRFRARAAQAQRLMDDVVDLEIEAVGRILEKIDADPEPAHVKERESALWRRVLDNARRGRRTGTGPTAVADMLAGLGLAYGSDAGLDMVERVYRELKLSCYRSSVDMARELGPFPIWRADREASNTFLLRIRDEDPRLYADMQRFGRRNIALLTTAPVGTTSTLAGPAPYFGTTSGIEPLFTDRPYVRRKKITPDLALKGARVDFVDQTGDRWTNFPVFHAKLQQWMDVTGETDLRRSPYAGSCANDLDWKQRVRLQALAQAHVEHGISSTINLPEDATPETIAQIYEEAWRSGCKGITVYRDKCRDGVLLHEAPPAAGAADAKPRPAALPGHVYHLGTASRPLTVAVGLMDGRPYEVFGIRQRLDRSVHDVTLVKKSRGLYQIHHGDAVAASVSRRSEAADDTEEALCRMVSTALRHGADLRFVVHQLEKTRGDMMSLAKGLARALKRYVADGTPVTGESCGSCGSEELVRQEGCVRCAACGWSKC